MRLFSRALAVAALALTLSAANAFATTYTIDDKTDVITGGIGDFYLVTGNDPASSPGQVTEVLGGPSCCLQNADPETDVRQTSIGTLWTLLSGAGFTSASKLVFGFGLNQTGSIGSNYVDITALTMSFVLPDSTVKTYSLGTNDLVVYNYAQGQNTAEVRFGVDLGFDFMQAYSGTSSELFTISSTIGHTDDGFEIYFLSSAFTADANPGSGGVGSAVPEPASLTLFGTGLAFVATQIRRRRKTGR